MACPYGRAECGGLTDLYFGIRLTCFRCWLDAPDAAQDAFLDPAAWSVADARGIDWTERADRILEAGDNSAELDAILDEVRRDADGPAVEP